MNGLSRKLALGALVIIVLLALSFWAIMMTRATGSSEGRWAGVDEAVIEKYAADAGSPAREPLINTDNGDILLFVFAMAGGLGGFVAGYCWRMLFTGQRNKKPV